MRVFILGVDGYIGWALAQYLSSKGHKIGGLDSQLKRNLIEDDGVDSIIPIESIYARQQIFSGINTGDAGDYSTVKSCFTYFEPDCIVNLAQIPSAPFSMRGHAEAFLTQTNNNATSLTTLWAMKEVCPHVPLITLGTLGEFGLPNTDIPEGDFELEFNGRKDRLQFPRLNSSLYHCSKTQSSTNCDYLCRTWGLTITDIMQGVIYGTQSQGMETPTSFYIDETWGTVLNRMCAQAVINYPLTVYGEGKQVRGMIQLQDALRCIELLMNNPPEVGEYRVVNQYDQAYSINRVAEIVSDAAIYLGFDRPEISHLENPRVEKAEHYYNPLREKLVALGYEPKGEIENAVREIIEDLIPYRKRIADQAHTLLPTTKW
jgi:nucleoside-diphosphate-sugar epimerase